MTRAAEIPAVNGTESEAGRRAFWPLTLGCMGVVYGDIGTSPLYAFRVALRGCRRPSGRPVARNGARRVVAHPVGADPRRHREICAHSAARRQQGRRRHIVPDGPCPAGSRLGPLAVRGSRARHDRRGSVLRRCSPYAGHLGAVGGRRPGGGSAAAEKLCGAAHGADPRSPVFRTVARHRPRRHVLRPGDDAVVPGAWAGGPHAYRRRSGRARGLQSCLCRSVSRQPRHDRAGHAWRRIPCGDRSRGPLRRSRPFRAKADQDGVALFRAAGARSQLSRSGRAGALRPDGDRQTPSTGSCRHGRSIR